MPFHSTTIFTLAYLLPLSLAHLPQQKTPFKLAIFITKALLTHTLASFSRKQSCYILHLLKVLPYKNWWYKGCNKKYKSPVLDVKGTLRIQTFLNSLQNVYNVYDVNSELHAWKSLDTYILSFRYTFSNNFLGFGLSSHGFLEHLAICEQGSPGIFE